MHRQKGFTLAELVIVLAVISIMLTFFIYTAKKGKISTAKLQASVAMAGKIAATAERVRETVTGTSVVSGIYKHTYATLPTNSTVADLVSIAADGSSFPLNSSFDTPFRIEITSQYSKVTFFMPDTVSPANAQAVAVTGGTDLSVYGYMTKKANKLNNQLRNDAAFLYLESPR